MSARWQAAAIAALALAWLPAPGRAAPAAWRHPLADMPCYERVLDEHGWTLLGSIPLAYKIGPWPTPESTRIRPWFVNLQAQTACGPVRPGDPLPVRFRITTSSGLTLCESYYEFRPQATGPGIKHKVSFFTVPAAGAGPLSSALPESERKRLNELLVMGMLAAYGTVSCKVDRIEAMRPPHCYGTTCTWWLRLHVSGFPPSPRPDLPGLGRDGLVRVVLELPYRQEPQPEQLLRKPRFRLSR